MVLPASLTYTDRAEAVGAAEVAFPGVRVLDAGPGQDGPAVRVPRSLVAAGAVVAVGVAVALLIRGRGTSRRRVLDERRRT
ncbi:hypothetical protein ACIB24_10145 [Spongisporangium articulatum]|uniref:Uncharacterized protein n=1 Tax=Spongisporangium articulatum TaxID=3362603 RepID=A0ABW8AN91_9ACTN